MEIIGQEAEIEFTLEITRKETGKTEIYHMKGRTISDENADNANEIEDFNKPGES